MRDVQKTIETDEIYLNEIKALNDEIDRTSLKLIEDTVKLTNQIYEAKLWLERQLFEECGMKPDRDYEFIKFERKKK